MPGAKNPAPAGPHMANTSWHARRLTNPAIALVLRILGTTLGVLQVAPAVQLMLRGLPDLGVLSA